MNQMTIPSQKLHVINVKIAHILCINSEQQENKESNEYFPYVKLPRNVNYVGKKLHPTVNFSCEWHSLADEVAEKLLIVF